MAPRTRCRCTGQRQASTAVWITDAMLTQALKRYENRCFASCRRLSSHGSALERHRRLGKRHMTDFMPPTPMYRPMWHFEVFGNPTSWTWSPPSTSRERRERDKEITFKSLFNRLVAWLEDSDLGQPFLKAPEEISADQAISNTVTPADETEAGGLAEISMLRNAILACQGTNVVAYAGMIVEYVTCVKVRLESQDVQAGELFQLLEPIELDLLQKLLPEKAALNVYTAIYTSVVDSVGELVRKQLPGPQKLWTALVERSMELSSCRVKFRHFRALMYCSRRHKLDIKLATLFEATHSIISELSAKKKYLSKSNHWKQRMVLFLHQNITAQQRVEMYRMVNGALKQATVGTEATLYIRQFWLYVMASDDDLARQTFSDMIMQSIRSQGPLGDRATWHLALARMRSTGMISASARESLMRLYHKSQSDSRYHSDYTCWVALVSAVVSKSGHASRLRALRDVMVDFGKPKILGISLLWTGLGDFSESSARVMKMIVKHPRMDERFIWEECLDIGDGPKSTEQHRLDLTSLKVVAQMKLLDQMIGWYLESTHLSERQILRRIEWCVTGQQRLVGHVSASGMVGLLKTVVSDLEKGMNGRLQRTKWILHLIEKNRGSQEAVRVKTALRRWRSLLAHKWQMDRSSTWIKGLISTPGAAVNTQQLFEQP